MRAQRATNTPEPNEQRGNGRRVVLAMLLFVGVPLLLLIAAAIAMYRLGLIGAPGCC